jgi:glutamate-ammonia-ligase adenylyltransferase
MNNITNQKKALELIHKHSAFLSKFLRKYPEIEKKAVLEFNKERTFNQIYSEIKNFISYELNEDDFIKKLRLFKIYEYTIIAANDLYYKYDIPEITRHISNFAESILQITYEYSLHHLKQIHGKPIDNEKEEVEFAVIGLGKLGGKELNFSSDIDIIFVYDTEKGKTEGVNGKNSIANSIFFTKLSENIKKIISERTEDGIVYRVDLRLRPDGEKGDIALPLRSYEIYYELYGQSWERMMLLKARTVAGSKKTGENFIKMVSPFVFRRSIDYKLIDDLKDIKNKINKRIQLKIKNKRNVKLGKGGIREIEFIVQALQILNYPKNREVFHLNTIKALEILSKYELLSKEKADFLKNAYCFLRKLEHMAQIEAELQTHVIPEDSDTFNLYLERCGFSSKKEFFEKYEEITENVNKIFNSILSKESETKSCLLFDEELEIEDIAEILKTKNIKKPLECAKLLHKIVFGRKTIPRSSEEIKILKILLEKIVEELANIQDQMQTLRYFDRFFSRRTSIYLFYEIFEEMPIILKKLVNIFSISPYISELIITNNNLLDYIYDPKEPIYKEDDIITIFNELISNKDDEEILADKLRKKHKELMFNAGYAYLNKEINIIKFMKSLTALASATVNVVFDYFYKKLSEKFGYPLTEQNNACQYLIVGMGKLGSGEMSFGSDLDLIVLFEEHGYTSGEKQITNAEFFAKLVQKLIFFLSTLTAQGYLYKIDMRLRPSGASGTLVSTIKGFEDYQHKSAMLWEKQALLRASVINKSTVLSEKFDFIREEILFSKEIDNKGIKEIKEMRMRIETEKGGKINDNNIKAGYGGLIDIEFVTQMLQLKYGQKYQILRKPNTHFVLHSLKELEIISNRDFYALHNSYLFFRHLENIIRAYFNSDSSKLPKNPEVLEKLGTFFGFSSNIAEKLENEYQTVRKTVRAAFNRIFDKYLNE